MDRERVLVIGAGIVGTVAVAQLKADGLEPVCYERSENYGGTWYYRKETMNGQASLMPTTIINHSKEMGALSNFPPRKEFSNYMRHTQLYQYISDYAKHHDCEKHIHYKMQVIRVKKADDYKETGKWSVTTKNLITGEVVSEIFDGVLVATGHNNMPTMPTFPGQEDFAGEIMHSHSLKEVEKFTDKRVVVVGIGCSGLDAAVGISRVAKQVYLSTRCGAFIMNRIGRHGYPFDYVMLRRYLAQFLDILPINLCSWYLEKFYFDTVFDHRLYYKKPKYHFLCRDPIVNDHIGSKLLSGLVIQKGAISKFQENGVLFEGEDTITEVDVVIMATGYSWGYPFLEDGTITTEGEMIHLYKCMYPPHLPHPTLAILGFTNPLGAGFPQWELQGRLASYLLSGKGKLPSEEAMMKDVVNRYTENEKRYIPGDRQSVRTDYVQYQDELAEQIGVRPRLLKYLVSDFPLYLRLLFGPSLPYQYRLEGHGKWERAREAIMTADDRVQWPLRRKSLAKRGIIEYVLDYFVNLIPINAYIWH